MPSNSKPMNVDELARATVEAARKFGANRSGTILFHGEIAELGDVGKILGWVYFGIDRLGIVAFFFTESGLLCAHLLASSYGSNSNVYLRNRKLKKLETMTPQAIFQESPKNYFVPYSSIAAVGLSKGNWYRNPCLAFIGR